jgi:hypothetical protein
MQIDKNIHYFALMEPTNFILGSFSVSFVNSHSDLEWFECLIDESQYKVDDQYKITLRNINGSEYRHYYINDFKKLAEDGYIIPKTSDKMHIKNVSFKEYIPGTIAYLQHDGQCIVED